MPLLGFTMFKEQILNGSKRQTIRLLGKRPKKEGDMLYLYWHPRQPDCEPLGKSTCVEAFPIQLRDEYFLGRNRMRVYLPSIDDEDVWLPMSIAGADLIARLDGFSSSDDMRLFFVKHYALPDVFQVIRWGDLSEIRH